MRKTTKTVDNFFALALKKDSLISPQDIQIITDECQLHPLFFVIDDYEAIYPSRFMARIFDAPVIRISGFGDFCESISRCSFSVCESLKPAVFSLISGKPAYVDAKDDKCRTFMGKMAKAGCPRGILIPYTKNRLSNIKKVGAFGSDFGLLVDKIIKNIPFS